MNRFGQPPVTGGDPNPAGKTSVDTEAAGGRLAGFEARLLSELQLVVAEQAAAAGQHAGRRTRRARTRRAWPRPLLVTGASAAALAAGLVAALTVTATGPGTQPAAPHFAPATTVVAVLDNAATAALRAPAAKPRPGQFVYTSMRLATNLPRTTQTIESWRSVSGTQVGATITSGPTTRTTRIDVNACVNGFIKPAVWARQRCTARQFAAYQPWLPTTAAGMLAYLKQTSPRDGSAAQSMLEQGFYQLTDLDLTPAQQAAIYHALAQVPGLRVVPKVTDILGRAGVGIRSHLEPNSSWTAIFSRTTFQLLGSDVEATGPAYDRTAMAVHATTVNKVGQRP